MAPFSTGVAFDHRSGSGVERRVLLLRWCCNARAAGRGPEAKGK
jgi:hypothetical protein